MRLARWRDETGALIAYAWPGGSPVVYVDREDDDLCPNCASAADRERMAARAAYLAVVTRDGADEARHSDEYHAWQLARDDAPVAGFVYVEGPPRRCTRCQAVVASAYGDPDDEEAA